MILKTQASYPQSHSFVLKLHRDATPSDGVIVGRLEHVVSGKQFAFTSVVELIVRLVQAAAESASYEVSK